MIYGSTGREPMVPLHASLSLLSREYLQESKYFILAEPARKPIVLYSSENARKIIIVYSRTIPRINVKGGVAGRKQYHGFPAPWVLRSAGLSSRYFLSTILCNYAARIFRNIVVLDILES